jgi:organic radical activating enzyme
MNNNINHVKATKQKLDEVGPGFCLLKWTQETLYLQTGDNHSCYHPFPHKVQISDIKNNPSGLHNTAWKKQQRKEMLEGGRPKECSFCWRVEDTGHLSDRVIHSAHHTTTHIQRAMNGDDYSVIKNLDWDANYNPKFLEVNFGNVCNFKCGYCTPTVSNSWIDEIKEFGDYPIKSKQYSISFLKDREYYESDDESNPYVKAFWDWWPSLKNDLQTLRITGGEPSLNQNTWKLLDHLEQDPCPNMTLLINSNLGVKPALLDRMSKKVKLLLEKKCIKDFRMHCSLDTWGAPAEYMRTGLDCAVWEQNFLTMLDDFTDIQASIEIMVTYNNLAVASFRTLLEKILEWRAKYSTDRQRVDFCTPHLKEPAHWMINILPDSFQEYVKSDIEFMKANLNKGLAGFNEVEVERLERVLTVMQTYKLSDNEQRDAMRDFAAFFTEHDKRRRTDFYSTFPEYISFMEECKKI